MKNLLIILSVVSILFLWSCDEATEKPNGQEEQGQPVDQSAGQPQGGADTAVSSGSAIHKAVVLEVAHATSYTYLKVKEGDSEDWLAIPKKEITVGESIVYNNSKPLLMKNFESKDLKRTFESVYFLSGVQTEAEAASGKTTAGHSGVNMGGHGSMSMGHAKKPAAIKKVSVEVAKGGISIGDLYAKQDSYKDKVVRVRGQVVKVNKEIMGMNWVHLQDGTGQKGTNDLLVTTQELPKVGDIVIFEGSIVLNKDFGAGYSYSVLMQKGKIQAQ